MNVPVALDAVQNTRPRLAMRGSILSGLALMTDVACITAAGIVAFLVAPKAPAPDLAIFSGVFIVMVAALLIARAKRYAAASVVAPVGTVGGLAWAVATAFLFLLSVLHSLDLAAAAHRIWLFGFAGLSVAGVAAGRLMLAAVLDRVSRHQPISRTFAVLGGGEQARRLVRAAQQRRSALFRLYGVFSAGPERSSRPVAGQAVLGSIEQLIVAIRRGEIDDVVIALPWMADREIADAVARLRDLPVDVHLASDLAGHRIKLGSPPSGLDDLPLFSVANRPIAGWQTVAKTALDHGLALIGLIVALPVLVAVAVAIRLDSPGSVLFRQRRLGFNNRPFTIYKFRTMYHEDRPGTVRQARRDDPRITRVGRWLRRSSLDELPQLLNVLNGTMSLVGPRPHAVSHNEVFARHIGRYFARHNVKPGITGLAQVNGLRGEIDTPEKIEARVACDVAYAENWSLALDLRILALTVLRVPFQRSAY